VPALKFFDVLLGDEPALTADVNFYQRLLAHDQDEALEILHTRLKEVPLGQVFDEIVVTALVSARSDFESGALSDSEMAAILVTVRELIEEIGSEPSAPAPTETRSATPLMVLGCAARDASDEAALEMLQRIVDPGLCQIQIVLTDRLVSEVVEMVAKERPSIVCIASLPPGGLAHTRLLCKRLRTRYPDLKITVGRWGLQGGIERNREQLTTVGANDFATSLRESAIQLIQLGHFLQTRRSTTGDSQNSNTAGETVKSTKPAPVGVQL
jgi:hypothetical protein